MKTLLLPRNMWGHYYLKLQFERAEYEFEGIKYRFQLVELPNDVKMLAMLAGELTISISHPLLMFH